MKDLQKQRRIREINEKPSSYFDKGTNAKIDKVYKKNFLKSAEYYKKILKLQPCDIDALLMAGGALSNVRRYKQALKFLNKAIKLNPKEPFALENKGITLHKLGKNKEALRYFNKVLKIEPQREHTKINKWYTLEELERYDDEFYRLLDLIVKKDPDYFEALFHKAVYLVKRGKPKKAIIYYRKALRVHDKICKLKRCEYRDEIFIKLLSKIKVAKLFFRKGKHSKNFAQSKCIRDLKKILSPVDKLIIEYLIENKNICLRKELLKKDISNATLTRRLDWLKKKKIITIEKESRRRTKIKLIKKNLNRETFL